ncbi:MAG TPA: T9SS type A sorting domain-containing protein [Cytophagaceae bacterium]|jgi:hypothetical protein|nr:T9SS type A sorting domain-containing protein [Cytophagaceae bacterium]
MRDLIIFLTLIAFTSLTAHATIYTVNANTWTNTGVAGTGDLRYCIAQANADVTAGPHTINFAAGITGPIAWSTSGITIGNATQKIIINGESATGWSCGSPTVIIQYTGPWAQNQLPLQGSGVILKSLIIQGFSPRLTAGTSEIYGCWFNLDATGAAASAIADAMGATFMYLTGGTNHIIGSNDCNRNVFGMTGSNAWQGFVSINGANGSTINGNYFGTGKTGLAKISNFNGGTGVIMFDGTTSNITISNNVIGCAGGSKGRSINSSSAINLSGLTISGNKIGLDANGNVSAGFGNDNGGIVLIGGVTGTPITISNNDIGSNGSASFDNNSCGIIIASAFSNLTISGNYIGVTRAFANAGNAFAGIFVTTAINTLNLTNNVIGFNGQCCTTKSHAWELTSCTNITATGNYIGVSPGGADLGNGNSGMVFSSCSNAIITNNYVCFNNGARPSIPNGGIVITGGNDFTIQNNSIGITPIGTAGGQKNIGADANGGSGIYIENGTLRARIGGLVAGQQNTIAYSAKNGIELNTATTDFIEMRYNSIYCNAQKGINLNSLANANMATPTITGPNPSPPTTISGTKPANTYLDVFGSNLCAAACIATPQGQLYKGEATTYPAGTAGTTWTFAPGGNIYDYLTAEATGVTGTANCTVLGIATCRSSEFSNCENNILPVEFIGIDAEFNTNRSTTVSWQTAVEINNSYFVVTRSNDGQNFTSIGVIDGKGTAGDVSSYSFIDDMSFSGTTYYRIKQVDKDGSAGYSPIAAVMSTHRPIRIYPNPASDNIMVESGEFSEGTQLVIYDILGKAVKSNCISGNKIEINISDLPSGAYFIKINTNNNIIIERFIKK